MEDRNYRVKRTCPHCGNTDARLMPPLGDYSEYDCPTCGAYRIDGTTEQLIENRTFDPRAAHIVQRGSDRYLVE
jgi:predicted RNA-binding Zn-ribbon protein involved in translation (DUF1610 family)